ncbi:MAG: hypothetical protein J7641_00230 [Cyanobacteria bacterium SID2]|nr:hypothetical protein [Cyanobacteria bacterium SID2]MBP0005785.1 hypothetical protein [Cyanobacteria bacterium SBC]
MNDTSRVVPIATAFALSFVPMSPARAWTTETTEKFPVSLNFSPALEREASIDRSKMPPDLAFSPDSIEDRQSRISLDFEPPIAPEKSGSFVPSKEPFSNDSIAVEIAPLEEKLPIPQATEKVPEPNTPSPTPVPVPPDPPPVSESEKNLPPPPKMEFQEVSVAEIPESWWEMGANSPLAIALGCAEGTRRSDGGKNLAYYWHTDPGNFADNFGTFSWQHLPKEAISPVVSASSEAEKRQISDELGLPEQADRDGLARLKKFYEELRQQALTKGISLDLRELIEGLDLSNQAPLAGLSSMGYLDRLAEMRQSIDDRDEQILEARVWSYWHPERDTWDAPGLGNTYDRIRHDQQRRMAAIDEALAMQQQQPARSLAGKVSPFDEPLATSAAESISQRLVPCMLCGV